MEKTNKQGEVIIEIDYSHRGETAELAISVEGYQDYSQVLILDDTDMVIELARVPTPTPIPTRPPATDTPSPTNTLTPTDTPELAVLAPREPWVQDGVVLTLAGGYYDVDNSCIGMWFEFKNESNDTIIVAGKARNFRAEDNLGQTWRLKSLGGPQISFNKCDIGIDEKFLERVLGPGEEFPKYSDFAEKGFLVGFTGPLTDSDVEYLDVIVDGFSRITNARWRIPIKH